MKTWLRPIDKDLYAGYEAEIRDYRLDFGRDWAYIAIGLVIVGVGLDYALYPQMQFLFGEVRLGVSLLIFCVILLMKTQWGRTNSQWLTFIWLLLPQIMITWMISKTEGATSQYYAGLLLAIFASGFTLPFSVAENVTFSVMTYAMYACACHVHGESFGIEGQGPFVVNSIFLMMSAIVSAVCTHFNDRARFMLFRLNAEVAQKNNQLEDTNKSLAQIKGKMLQQEKMAAIGTLAAGLLHEVNNPVNFCMMAIDLAMEEPVAKGSSTLSECLVDAKSGMQRVQHIVTDLKIFAYRKPNAEASGQAFMFEKAFNSAVRLTGHELRGIKVTRDIAPDNLVFGDEAAIIGVLINLLSNASIAFSKAGTVAPAIHVSAAWKGGRLFISARDNGPGISPENLTRVFEPFFTTREIGQGLGLGLSISYSVIQRHGGVLVAESVVGEWTEMSFDLPRAE